VPKIAVVGANGQVGAELCLLLARQPGIDLVPICRNRTGSAFLRSCGIAVRHGRVADSQDVGRLLSDCDLVVNSSLASGTPREIRNVESALIKGIYAASPSTAAIVHFSTQNVYGDPRPGRLIRTLSPYGRTKVATERVVRRAAAATGKRTFILRLGHVGGELQGITLQVRKELRLGTAILPDRDTPSNLVYTVTLADAVCRIAAGGGTPGTYDMMNSPPWSWRQVYEYEAERLGVPFAPALFSISAGRRSLSVMSRLVAAAGAFATIPAAKDFGAKLFAYAPEQMSSRGTAWWYRKRARDEIAALGTGQSPGEHLYWLDNGRKFIEGLAPTRDLLARDPYRDLARTDRAPWPSDLADAQSV
jgi:nucleoside-diphosphate-sugar epimerase